MFGLGVPELLLILVIALVVFGPGKLPSIGAALGKSKREFKDAVNAVENIEPQETKKGTQEPAETDKNPPAAALCPAHSLPRPGFDLGYLRPGDPAVRWLDPGGWPGP